MAEHYLGMREGDLDDKPYAQYWNPDMQPLSKNTREAVAQGPQASELLLNFEDAKKLLENGYLPVETGYGRIANGQRVVSCLTPMPNVTGEMIDWWFGWHGVESQRYKLWHPRAHVSSRMENTFPNDSKLTNREKYIDNVSYVDEYIGDEYHQLTIAFKNPKEFGLDESEFAKAGVTTAICARVSFTKKPIHVARLIHLIRKTKDGSEMRSRFWVGDVALKSLPEDNTANKIFGQIAPTSLLIKDSLAHDLLVHCSMEMTHLASFLPDLFKDYSSD